jgi:RNA polymerase sigma factor (sigma-70 family)
MFRSAAKDTRLPPLGQPRPALPGWQPADTEDAELIEKVVQGDVHAFEALYRAYHPRLMRFLSLVTPRRPIVEESLNDTMLAVWRRAQTYNRQSKVSTWIFAIAYHTACKALRKQDLPVEDTEGNEPAGEHDGPERRHSDRELGAALRRALDGLSHEQRNVIVLTYFHDLPYAEIAQIMECPVDTVKTRMFHGRRRLRALLTGESGDWL